ncbi:hypothetical protein COCC4DRAFT_124738 [Bipolaris maydis ATCC 48331]|uniref:Uncharacterized protein n=2 Tax=Cochliobolus heterostrophus TaxID=5016 RepID=M2UPS7_COCH5|nr:uncharacterized protein COCC4DRAFT_124738 [Bipolaris maydis ATCC 48331]EMD89923.1 hypothetical protein COCHEDRAFT_1106295 [Bipolaris maydis C5]KAJ5063988.1 hypothetical protein J3E74DRAFT_205965 [Bipolaris maydis]ENI09865.1 hypothetical protein COCC4DRAFT_124738 [Bipolaris maydis ATCC 48331]KAJ6196862.1 hypothetical protein J3E72DRAFT_193220 [Bipolaris maydis]KAJ6207753.1 hypothetical protein PSV09DRAFT_1106295 [Bipolaris maydis]
MGAYDDPLADCPSDLSSPSSPTQTASMSDSEEPSSKEINRRLAQALDYLDDQGSDDSPRIYMERVARINDYLVQQLPQQEVNFDNALYQHLRDTVRQEQEAYNAVRQSARTVPNNKESLVGSGSDVSPGKHSGYHSASVAHALHREDEQIYDPAAGSLRKGHKTQEMVQTRRTFKYGGLSSDAEVWHRNFPAILPFPETHQLAHWESLKIAFDLDESVKKQKAEGDVVETNVSFDHPALDQYKNLELYESGSRFKLPTPPKEIEEEIRRLCTVDQIAKAVDEFNTGEDEDESGKKYAPRIFLDKLSVHQKDGPTDIRRAINTSPTKPRQRAVRSVLSSVAESTLTMVQTPAKLSPGKPQASLPQTRENRVVIANDLARMAREEAQSAEKIAHAAREKARKATLDALRIADQANGKVSPDNCVSSPISRMINREREMSLEKSPRRQSGVSTAPPSAETTPTDVVPIEEPDDAPGSEPLVVDMSQLVHTLANVTTPKPSSGRTVRRKRSIGDEAYTPESKRSKVGTPSSLGKGASGKQQTSGKSTGSYQTTAATRKSPVAKKPAAKSRTKPRGKPANTAAAVKQEGSKATAPGKAVQRIRAKKVVREHVCVDEHMEELEETAVEIAKVRGTRGGARHAK